MIVYLTGRHRWQPDCNDTENTRISQPVSNPKNSHPNHLVIKSLQKNHALLSYSDKAASS